MPGDEIAAQELVDVLTPRGHLGFHEVAMRALLDASIADVTLTVFQ